MLPLPQIIVGTPDYDVLLACLRAAARAGKLALDALHIGKDPITPFIADFRDGLFEGTFIIHSKLSPAAPSW
jgi:hypothetical protein